MAMDELKSLQQNISNARKDFYAKVASIRPELFRYCSYLTTDIWDAEDLCQETLCKAFSNLASNHKPVTNLKAYLFRAASNAWIDWQRKHKPQLIENSQNALEALMPEKNQEEEQIEMTHAFKHILQFLTPLQRICIVLKDGLSFSNLEVASMVHLSEGSVKLHLHRARKKLNELQTQAPETMNAPTLPQPSQAMVEKIAELFNQRDAKGLRELMSENIDVELMSFYRGQGKDFAEGVIHHTFEEDGLLNARVITYLGEPLIALWYEVSSNGEAPSKVVRDFWRFKTDNKLCTRLASYYFCADTIQALAEEQGFTYKTQGYDLDGC